MHKLRMSKNGRLRLDNESLHVLIWESVNGSVPRDESGKKFDVHHMDFNPLHNEIENLQCLSHSEHMALHQRYRMSHLSEETRAKMAAAKLGRKRSEESVAKTAAGNKGQKRSLETRQLMSLHHGGGKRKKDVR